MAKKIKEEKALVLRKCTVSTEVRLRFDPSDKDFVQTLKDYRAVIDPDATQEEMLDHVAASVVRYRSLDCMIEGVGYVARLGEKPGKEKRGAWSGIWVEGSYDDSEVVGDYDRMIGAPMNNTLNLKTKPE